jgi:hypothetical protein
LTSLRQQQEKFTGGAFSVAVAKFLDKINITCLSKDRFFEEVMCEKHPPSFFVLL